MSIRVYVLMEIVEGQCERVIKTTRSRPGVLMADWLDDSSDVIVVIEALNRERLAELVMPVLASIENVTEDVHLLVGRGEVPHNKDWSRKLENRTTRNA